LKDGTTIGLLPLHNNIYKYYAPREAYGGFIGFGERTTKNRDRRHSGVESVPAYMFFSRPPTSDKKSIDKPDIFQIEEGFVGLSSYDVPSFVKVESYVDLGIESETINGDEHQPIDVNLYGNENTGKFYTFLPLIKI
jgi:hypothetical protein